MNKPDRTILYNETAKQLEALLDPAADFISNLSNVAALLHENLKFQWTGFYLVKNEVLVLGPFQGPVACVKIEKGKGVCGSSWAQKKTLVVQDVKDFPGYISCSSATQSEIVVPLVDPKNRVWAVLDIDSEIKFDFDESDALGMERLAKIIQDKLDVASI